MASPNFRVYVPPKAAKETEKEVQQQESGEIKEDDKETAPQNANLEPSSEGEQTMEDVEEDTHLDEDTIQEQLLPCPLEPVELEEAVVEQNTNGELPPLESVNITMNEEDVHHTGDADRATWNQRSRRGMSQI
jgi:hypothetical protein